MSSENADHLAIQNIFRDPNSICCSTFLLLVYVHRSSTNLYVLLTKIARPSRTATARRLSTRHRINYLPRSRTPSLEDFMLCFGIVRRMLQVYSGIDVTSIVSICMIATLILGALKDSLTAAWEYSGSWCTSSISVREQTRIYKGLATWISYQHSTVRARHLRTHDYIMAEPMWTPSETNVGFDATMPPFYHLALGDFHFCYQGRLILGSYEEGPASQYSKHRKQLDARFDERLSELKYIPVW